MYVCFLDDDDLRNIRRQKSRDRYANMPSDKKAELNAKKGKLSSKQGKEAICRFVTCCYIIYESCIMPQIYYESYIMPQI